VKRPRQREKICSLEENSPRPRRHERKARTARARETTLPMRVHKEAEDAAMVASIAIVVVVAAAEN